MLVLMMVDDSGRQFDVLGSPKHPGNLYFPSHVEIDRLADLEVGQRTLLLLPGKPLPRKVGTCRWRLGCVEELYWGQEEVRRLDLMEALAAVVYLQTLDCWHFQEKARE